MVKNMKRFALMLCVLVLCVSTLGTVAFAAAPVTARIPVKVTLEGTLPAEAETFVIQLTPDQASNPMPEGTANGVYTTQIVGEGTAVIEISYTKVGIYDYTVKQLPGDNENCTYCTDTYKVTVFVTNSEKGGLDVSVVAYKNGDDEKTDIEFPNEYADPDHVTVVAIKTMDGKTPRDGAFTFQLIDEDGKVVEVQNVGRDVVFPEMTYYAEGTYKYTLKEVKGDEKTIAYDTTVYEVIVEVTKNADGDYEAKVTYMKNGKVYEGTPVFSNVTINPEVPDTGDNGRMYTFAALMAVSAAAIFVVLFLMKRQKKEEA